MANIEEGPPGENMLEDTERDNSPVGDWVADGGSDGKKDAGEEGGATKGSDMEGGWIGRSCGDASVPEAFVSGTRLACPIRLLLLDPKHQ